MSKKRKTDFEELFKKENKYIKYFKDHLKEDNVKEIANVIKEIDDLITLIEKDKIKVIEEAPEIIEFYNFFCTEYHNKPVFYMIYDYFDDDMPKVFKMANLLKANKEAKELSKFIEFFSDEELTEIYKLTESIMDKNMPIKAFALYDDYQDYFSNIITIEKYTPDSFNWLFLHIIYCMHTNGLLIIVNKDKEVEYVSGYGFSKKNVYNLNEETMNIIINKTNSTLKLNNFVIK